MRELEREVAQFADGAALPRARASATADQPRCSRTSTEVEEDLLGEPRRLPRRRGERRCPSASRRSAHGLRPLPRERPRRQRRHAEGAPVVVERNPTYYNLLGRIEYRATFGAMVTDFRQIKAGALHRANGGFLVLDVLDVLRHPFAWEALKRALLSARGADREPRRAVQRRPDRARSAPSRSRST